MHHQQAKHYILCLVLLCIGSAALFLLPLSADASAIPLPHHSSARQQSRFVPGSALLYHGGPVMYGAVKAYAIFWEPKGSYVSPTYNSLIKRFFNDIGHSLSGLMSQYHNAQGHYTTGVSLGGAWVDTQPYPSNPIFDANIQNEVVHAMNVNGWTASLHHAFFVFSAKGENTCIDQSKSQCSFTTFCAYHNFFGTDTIYAAMPYAGTNLSACGVPGSPNHDFDADSEINLILHELVAMLTDPFLNGWYDASGQEIGDLCAWNFGPPIYHGGDVLLNNHAYMLQKIWDNKTMSCVLI